MKHCVRRCIEAETGNAHLLKQLHRRMIFTGGEIFRDIVFIRKVVAGDKPGSLAVTAQKLHHHQKLNPWVYGDIQGMSGLELLFLTTRGREYKQKQSHPGKEQIYVFHLGFL